jgi:hypothetical protein
VGVEKARFMGPFSFRRPGQCRGLAPGAGELGASLGANFHTLRLKPLWKTANRDHDTLQWCHFSVCRDPRITYWEMRLPWDGERRGYD